MTMHGSTPMFGLTGELESFRREVRAWAVERLRPRAAELEWRDDPADRVAWDLVEEAVELGWRTFGLSAGGRRRGRGRAVDRRPHRGAELRRHGVRRAHRPVHQGPADPRPAGRRAARATCSSSASARTRAACWRSASPSPRRARTTSSTGPDFRFRTHAERRDGRELGAQRLQALHLQRRRRRPVLRLRLHRPVPAGARAARAPSSSLRDDPGFEVEKIHEKMSPARQQQRRRCASPTSILPADRLLGERRHRLRRLAPDPEGERDHRRGDDARHRAGRLRHGGRARARRASRAACRSSSTPTSRCRLAEMYCRARGRAQPDLARGVGRRARPRLRLPDGQRGQGRSPPRRRCEVALSAAETFGGLAIMYRDCGINKCVRDCMSFLHSDGAQDSHRLRIGAMIADEAGVAGAGPVLEPVAS